MGIKKALHIVGAIYRAKCPDAHHLNKSILEVCYIWREKSTISFIKDFNPER